MYGYLIQFKILSLKGRKNLSLPATQTERCNLDLPKSVIKTILKKQTLRRISESIVSKKKLLAYGICPRNVVVRSAYYPLLSKKQFQVELRRYRQIILSNKNIKSLSVSNMNFPLIRAIGALRNLQILEICLTSSQLIVFSKVLESLFNLRTLYLRVKGSSFEETSISSEFEVAVSRFGKGLLSRKYLKNVVLLLEQETLFSSEEIITNLLSFLGELNLKKLEMTLPINEGRSFDPNRVRKFLEKVQYLALSVQIQESGSMDKTDLFFQEGVEIPQTHLLYLFGTDLENLDEILLQCPNLQVLRFASRSVKEGAPGSLGAARDITDLEIVCSFLDDRDPAASSLSFNHLLLEAINLQKLNFVLSIREKDLENVNLIHEVLQNSQLKSYDLTIYTKREDVISAKSLRSFSKQITKLQSLENLRIWLPEVQKTKALEPMFEGFPKLKKLCLSVRDVGPSEFPLQSLARLRSVENLTIHSPDLSLKGFQKNFPQMKALHYLELQQYFWDKLSKIDMSHYKEKYPV